MQATIAATSALILAASSTSARQIQVVQPPVFDGVVDNLEDFPTVPVNGGGGSPCTYCPLAIPQCDESCEHCTITPQTCFECSAAVCEDQVVDNLEDFPGINVRPPVFDGDLDNFPIIVPPPSSDGPPCTVCPLAIPQCDESCQQCTITPQTCFECSAAVCEDQVVENFRDFPTIPPPSFHRPFRRAIQPPIFTGVVDNLEDFPSTNVRPPVFDGDLDNFPIIVPPPSSDDQVPQPPVFTGVVGNLEDFPTVPGPGNGGWGSPCTVCPQVIPQCDESCEHCTITPQSCVECSAAVCVDDGRGGIWSWIANIFRH